LAARRIAFLMEQTLGGVTHYLNLRREEAEADGIVPVWVPVDFEHGRLPWALRGSLLGRRALKTVLHEVEGFFAHTATIVLLAANHFDTKPAVLSSDGTPLNKREMRESYGLKPDGYLAEKLKRNIYRALFRRTAGLIAWSAWAKASLVEDYGCNEEEVIVIPPGVNLSDFAPGDRTHEVPRILFVGGDFVRKGGDMLLDVFTKRLRGRAELVLVTREQVRSEPGVQVHYDMQANSPALRSLYASCDIFALPSRADVFSLVCLEALASGLPLVTTRVGGIPEIVKDGKTGYVLSPNQPGALGDALEALVADRSKRLEMGAAARADACARFDARQNAARLFRFVASRC
jgi:glycosyltransferase involved in cell wall biosynthesis